MEVALSDIIVLSNMSHKKILPSHHSGKIVHHRHTSYGALAFLLLMATSILTFASRSVSLAAPDDPVTSTYSTHAVVPGPTPTIAPQIRTIVSGAVFTSGDPIKVGGTCPGDSLVKVFKNEVFGGAAICSGGNFTMDVSLFIGSNTLIARAYDTNNNTGPESAPVVVTRNLVGASGSASTPVNQFFVTSDIYYKGINVGEELKWPVTLSGGQAPYAVSIGWGDGKTDIVSRKEAGSFEIAHKYEVPGKGSKPHHTIAIIATDQTGEKSFLQLVTVVNGNSDSIISSVKQGYDMSGIIRIAWQLIALLIIIIISFWFGERWELHVLKRTVSRA